MRIGELAAAAGTTTRALRHYEHEGLLTSGRDPNGYRVYGEHAVVRVRNIRELLAIGFTIADVRAIDQGIDAFGGQLPRDPLDREHKAGLARDVIEQRQARARSHPFQDGRDHLVLASQGEWNRRHNDARAGASGGGYAARRAALTRTYRISIARTKASARAGEGAA